MKQKRLTRQESQQVTRARLVEAAERAFVRAGFDGASVEEISAQAGYSRGAFYSNFSSKDAIFLEVLDKRRLEIQDSLDAIFRQKTEAAERFRAVRDWYASQGQQRHWSILKSEFYLRAMRSREIRKRLNRMHEQELEAYSSLLVQYYSEGGLTAPDHPKSIALALLSVSEGLGTLSLIGSDPALERIVLESRNLAFDRLVASAAAQVCGGDA